MKKLFSIVIPIYKNELNLPITIPYIMEKIPILFPEYRVELVLVNDGSPDRSWKIMKEFQQKYPETLRVASLTHNFGQMMAIHCGISLAKGDAIGVISADLQDPFELFVDMLKDWKKGAELVCGVRQGRAEKGISTLFSKVTHWMIHRFINSQYPLGGFDFFLIDRSIANRYLTIKEKNGSPQVLLMWLGCRFCFLPYTRRKREVGKSGFTFSKKVKEFMDTFVTNTYLPLRAMSVIGFLCAFGAFAYATAIVICVLLMGRSVIGWSSLATLITFFSGLILVSLGVIGEYLWRIFDAVRKRPLYVVDQIIEKSEDIETKQL